MLKVTNKAEAGMRKVPDVGVVPKRRGRPPGKKPSVLATMIENNDPDITFLRDLTVSDPTRIVEGADPTKRYRWVEESKLRTRQFQGYAKVTDSKVRTNFDGNYMPPEGFDARRANKGGMVLCEIPETLAKKRDAIKQEKSDTFSRQMEARHISEMQQGGGTVLSANDSFVAGLANGD